MYRPFAALKRSDMMVTCQGERRGEHVGRRNGKSLVVQYGGNKNSTAVQMWRLWKQCVPQQGTGPLVRDWGILTRLVSRHSRTPPLLLHHLPIPHPASCIPVNGLSQPGVPFYKRCDSPHFPRRERPRATRVLSWAVAKPAIPQRPVRLAGQRVPAAAPLLEQAVLSPENASLNSPNALCLAQGCPFRCSAEPASRSIKSHASSPLN